MGRRVKATDLDSREARSRLLRSKDNPAGDNPYWRMITPGLHLGYRKGTRGGIWVGRKYLENGKYKRWKLGTADDIVDADGVDILSFSDADAKARFGPPDTSKGQLHAIREAMDYYMKQQRAESRSAHTTQYAIDRHIIPQLGSRKISRLTVEDITDWRNDLAKSRGKKSDGDSPREAKRKRQASANRVLTILKAALNYAERTGKYRGETPWKLVPPFRKVDATEHPNLSQDEAIRLQNACSPDFKLLVRGALETGCRYGEVCAVKISDFDPDAGTLTVRESKSGTVRHVHLTDSGQAFFDQVTIGKKRSELIFLRPDGEQWGKSHQSRPMKDACKIAGIDPPIPFKALRTTYGSLLAREGVPLQVIAAALGHSDTRITEKHYAHLMPNYVADTIRANLPTFGDSKTKVTRLNRK